MMPCARLWSIYRNAVIYIPLLERVLRPFYKDVKLTTRKCGIPIFGHVCRRH